MRTDTKGKGSMTSRFTTDPARDDAEPREGGPRLSGEGLGSVAPVIAGVGTSITGSPEGSGGTPRSGSRPDPGPPGAGVQPVQQPGSGLGLIVSFAIAAVVLVLAFYVVGEPRPNRLPLAQRTTLLFWMIAAVAVAGAVAGAIYAERTAARAAVAVGRHRSDDALGTAWIMPALATAASILLVATYHNTAMLVVGPLAAFIGNAGALLARDLLDDASDSSQRTATIIHALVIHGVAFLAFGVIYLNKMPVPVAAPLIGLVGGLLALETLERGDADRVTRLVYAALAGWSLAFAMVALDWWQTHGWTGGAVLLVCFYLASGVLLARTQRSVLRGRDLVEFGAVSLLAFAVLAATA